MLLYPFYRDLYRRFFPKMENRDYCAAVEEALVECRTKNYETHPPCKEIELFLFQLECRGGGWDSGGGASGGGASARLLYSAQEKKKY
jgi:hypothetical protein